MSADFFVGKIYLGDVSDFQSESREADETIPCFAKHETQLYDRDLF